MGVKKFKPTSPGRRDMSGSDFSDVTKNTPEKSLLAPLSSKGGRNNRGKITARHRGGGTKRKYRIIDFKRDKFDVPARVAAIEYDPNRTAFIARILYTDGERAYILAPNKLKKGDVIIASNKADVKPGNAMPLKNIPMGTSVHNVELKAGKGGQLGRSAGTSIQLVGRVDGYAQLKLPSGELRRVIISPITSSLDLRLNRASI